MSIVAMWLYGDAAMWACAYVAILSLVRILRSVDVMSMPHHFDTNSNNNNESSNNSKANTVTCQTIAIGASQNRQSGSRRNTTTNKDEVRYRF